MIKPGICSVDKLTWLDAWWTKHLQLSCNIALYEEVGQLDDAIAAVREEQILSRFTVSNGAYKRTSRNRMGEFDDVCLQFIRDMDCASLPLAVHDIAVSDGRTACDFYLKLSAALGNAIDFHASDICLKVIAIKCPERRLTILIDETGNALQLVYSPFVLPMRVKESWLFPINRLIRTILMRSTARALLRGYSSGEPNIEKKEVLLVCKEARQLLIDRSNFHLDRYDMFSGTSHKYSVCRAMNILNPSYFSDGSIALALTRIFESLEERGLFIVGSNGDAGSRIDGGIYQKRSSGFYALYRSGAGSAVNDLILRCGRSGVAQVAA